MSALIGALIGAGIPGILTYLGLRRGRQSTDAQAFGAAILLLDRVNPDRMAMNISSDATAEKVKWEELQAQLTAARERLLVVSAGHPQKRIRQLALDAEVKVTQACHNSGWVVHDIQVNRDNPEWMDQARKTHADAEAALRQLIDANFAWSIFGRQPLWLRRGPKTAKPELETSNQQIDARRQELRAAADARDSAS